MHVSRAIQSFGLLLALCTAASLSGCSGEIVGPVNNNANEDGSSDSDEDGYTVSDSIGDQFEIESDPGTRSLARLNNTEYNNTLQDLLGIDHSPANDFPADDRGYGFDNIADVLSVSPLLVEMYERTATEVAAEVMFNDFVSIENWHVEAEMATASVGSAYQDVGWNLYSNGTLTTLIDAPADGDYTITAWAFGQQAGPETVQMAFVVDGSPRSTVAVAAENGMFTEYNAVISIPAGPREVGVSFINDYYVEGEGDRNLIVDSFTIEGPLNAMTNQTNPLRERLMRCDPATDGRDACGRQIIESIGRRAWRRPLTNQEVDDLMAFVDLAEAEGDDFDMGIELALRAILLSPHFVFKVELDPDPTVPELHPLSDHELATRLSYFIWSSTPDEELLSLADQGRLQDDQVLADQVDRMLADERSEALVQNFAGQWLFIRAIDQAQPDVWYFPDWNDQLRADMRTEAEMFFRSVIHDDRPMIELLNGKETYVNQRLADHYGLAGTFDETFQPVSLEGTERVGWLTQGALLTSTSYATRTSPVRRGAWVLGELLCDEPDPPPPNVEGIPQENPEGATIRERMEAHSTDPVCASCHVEMDAIGFGLEHFDGVGAWREMDEGKPIDSTGELDGQTFNGATELAQVLATDPAFAECTTEKAFIYALGRGPTDGDAVYREAVADDFIDGGYLFRDLITQVVLSEPFRLRRGRVD